MTKFIFIFTVEPEISDGSRYGEDGTQTIAGGIGDSGTLE